MPVTPPTVIETIREVVEPLERQRPRYLLLLDCGRGQDADEASSEWPVAT